MKSWTGIDNGLDGGIATIWEDGSHVAMVMPVLKKGKGREVDVASVASVFPVGTFVLAEPAQTFAAGILSVASTHFTWGQIKAALILGRHRYQEIHPKTWQKAFWARPKMAKGQKFDTKAAALSAARRLWPEERFLPSPRCRVAHDGMVDALLIAEYARRNNL